VTKTVFWSWQSDLDGRVTRELIRSALDQAIGMLAADLEPDVGHPGRRWYTRHRRHDPAQD
jgi:hypothetical protein